MRGAAWLMLLTVGPAAGCLAHLQSECPPGTEGRRRIFSGGAEAEWCHRADGVHQGPEIRFYESGAPMIEGAYLDGVRQGAWRYYTRRGVAWRADRWEDGALVGKRVELPPRRPDAPDVDVFEPTDSLIIKTASADPTLGRAARGDELPPFAAWYATGKPRVLGHYDCDGLRTGTRRFWFDDGKPAREIEYDAGVRHRAFREWHENGRAKTDGFYINGERDGRWQRWDAEGRVVGDQVHGPGGMLPP